MQSGKISDAILLVVENVTSLREFLCEALRRLEGVSKVIGVEDGVEALKAIADEGPFDLVLTDITMPNMDGERLIVALNEQNFSGAIIVLSALGNEDLIIRCMRAGAVDYLVKPTSISDLHLAVYNALSQPPLLPEDIEIDYDPHGWFEVSGKSSYVTLCRFRRYLAAINNLAIPENVANEVRLSFEELGRNAIEWGNGDDDSKTVSFSCRILPGKIILSITDEGSGFKPTDVPDPSADHLAHIESRQKAGKRLGGYGIHLVRNLMD
jgi:two-component system chemotaxis response regulator CheY